MCAWRAGGGGRGQARTQPLAPGGGAPPPPPPPPAHAPPPPPLCNRTAGQRAYVTVFGVCGGTINNFQLSCCVTKTNNVCPQQGALPGTLSRETETTPN